MVSGVGHRPSVGHPAWANQCAMCGVPPHVPGAHSPRQQTKSNTINTHAEALVHLYTSHTSPRLPHLRSFPKYSAISTSFSPIGVLNQAWQLGLCTQPIFEAGEATGLPHSLLFHCTCTITHTITTAGDRRTVRHTGSGTSKAAAKRKCASLVLDDLWLWPSDGAEVATSGSPLSPELSTTALPELGLASASATTVAAADRQARGMPTADSPSVPLPPPLDVRTPDSITRDRDRDTAAAAAVLEAAVAAAVDVAAAVAALHAAAAAAAVDAAAAAAVDATASTEVEANRALLAGPLGMGALASRIAGPWTILTSVSVPVYPAAGGAPVVVTVEGDRCPCATGALMSAMRKLERVVLRGGADGSGS